MTFEPPATRAAPDIPAVRGTPDGNTWELTLIPESAAFACAADGRRIAPASATVSTNRADMSLIECILNSRGFDWQSSLRDGVLASGTPPEICGESRGPTRPQQRERRSRSAAPDRCPIRPMIRRRSSRADSRRSGAPEVLFPRPQDRAGDVTAARSPELLTGELRRPAHNELPGAERAARTLIDRSPVRETGYALLMDVLGAQGNAAEAMRVYDRARTTLQEELGIMPGRAIQQAHGRLLGMPAVP